MAERLPPARRLRGFVIRQIQLCAAELNALRPEPAPRFTTINAGIATTAVVIFGNWLVVLLRGVAPTTRELVTTVAIPTFGVLGCLILARAGCSRAALGLTMPSTSNSRRWFYVVLLAAVALTVVAVATDRVDGGDVDARLMLLRLCLGTAFGEELLFRGVLLALWLATQTSVRGAAVVNMVAFSAWHLAGAAEKEGIRAIADLLGPAIGAVLFLWARSRSRSVLWPWLLHYIFNLGGSLFVEPQSG